jgi:hypothetical protein
MTKAEFKTAVIEKAQGKFHGTVVKTKDVSEFFDALLEKGEFAGKNKWNCLYQIDEFRVKHGTYDFTGNIPTKVNVTPQHHANTSPEVLVSDTFEDEGIIPDIDKLYVSFGFHTKMKNIIKSGIFYPIYITGLSGNGKTKMVQQVCAETKRELIRVNVTVESDEDDLIGAYKLKNGSTIFEYGPVITAMKRGAVLLIDEIDLASPTKIMCLQSILEGAPYHIKKTGEHIQPAPGFTIVATANTKGRGSDDGRFIGANIHNEAFLERFIITVEQEYPTAAVEKNIILKLLEKFDIQNEEFANRLVKWAGLIREGYRNGSIDDLITTRRLVHIVKTFFIFNNEMEAIKLCLNRFDDDVKSIFLDIYSKLDDTEELTTADVEAA